MKFTIITTMALFLGTAIATGCDYQMRLCNVVPSESETPKQAQARHWYRAVYT